MMRAIILAESSQLDLAPLTDRVPHPLLPLAGKSILLHALETLHRSAIRNVEIVAPTLYKKLEAAIDTRPILGMQVDFRPQMLDLRHSQEPCLIIGLRDLVDINWNSVIDLLGEVEYHALVPIRLTTQGVPVALMIPPNFDGKVSCDWFDIYHTEAIQFPITVERLVRTNSVSDYYEANFSLLQGNYQYLTPAGREFTSGHRASPKARVNNHSIQSKHGYFGSNSKVDKSASLRGSVILGDNVIVDKGARVSDSIIFDRTYIGANTDCSDAIVSGNLMIKVKTGVCLELNDPLLFGAIA
jgi:mannose-1-phosphate guanylyltransferase/phosphomannomutase